jgi:hypothetical protein
VRQAINQALGALEIRMTAADAEAVQTRAATAILESMSRNPNEAQQMSGLLWGHLIPGPANEFRQHLLAAGALAGQGQPLASAAVGVPASQYSRPLPPQTLTELLNHPLCVGPARTMVLGQLARHYGRPFAEVWEFIRFAEEQKLPLDRAGSAKHL